MNKILFFFPENPIIVDSGNKARVMELLTYFKAKNFEVDFVYEKDVLFNDESDRQLIQQGFVKNVFPIKRKPKKTSFSNLNYFFYKLLFRKKPSLVSPSMKKDFNRILDTNQYDVVIISYIYYSALLNKRTNNLKKIIDTHDFVTSQLQQNKSATQVGAYFGEEINSIRRFDEVWAISSDEYYIFNQFHSNVKIISFIPTGLSKSSEFVPKKYDIIYIASENHHNLKSANWFFEDVYPLISKSLHILVIGKICDHIQEYDNVTKIRYAEDLSIYYQQAKMAICPMLTGTGVKIKVIEALFYSLPIVTNVRGVDGLSNKSNNGCLVANTAQEFADFITKLSTNNAFLQSISEESADYYNKVLTKSFETNINNTFNLF